MEVHVWRSLLSQRDRDDGLDHVRIISAHTFTAFITLVQGNFIIALSYVQLSYIYCSRKW